jgi:hypothetical protein
MTAYSELSARRIVVSGLPTIHPALRLWIRRESRDWSACDVRQPQVGSHFRIWMCRPNTAPIGAWLIRKVERYEYEGDDHFMSFTRHDWHQDIAEECYSFPDPRLICEQIATPHLRRNASAILRTGTVSSYHNGRQQDPINPELLPSQRHHLRSAFLR